MAEKKTTTKDDCRK